jgi:hypothetical protein
MSENVGTSTSGNPKGLRGLYRDNFTFTFIKSKDPTYGNCLKIPSSACST